MKSGLLKGGPDFLCPTAKTGSNLHYSREEQLSNSESEKSGTTV